MIKNVFDYFEDLHAKDLPKNEHSIIMDHDRIVEIDNRSLMSAYGKPNLSIDGTPYHAKKMMKRYPIMDTATGKMYNDIGIPTLPTYSLETDGLGARKFKTISQNVHSVKGLLFSIAAEILHDPEFSYFRVKNDYKWAVFYDKKLQQIFLKYMTPDCLEILEALFLIDEIRTEVDRHEDNYFLVKGPNDRKFKSIISLDNELGEIFLREPAPTTKERFVQFAKHPYFSYTPQGGSSPSVNYFTRIKQIKQLIQDQVLTPKQIKIIKQALQYDFPEEIRQAGSHPFLQGDVIPAYDSVSQLWDYNRTELGKELSM